MNQICYQEIPTSEGRGKVEEVLVRPVHKYKETAFPKTDKNIQLYKVLYLTMTSKFQYLRGAKKDDALYIIRLYYISYIHIIIFS